VQEEIGRRTARVAEIWNDMTRVKVSRSRTLGAALDAWDGALAELKRLGADVQDLEKQVEPYAIYVTDEAMGIREFYVSEAEKRWFAYNRWVMEVYNPAQRAVATESEARQVHVTNEYRLMMGYAASVKPGPGAYDALNCDTAAKILDEGRVLGVTPLRAVRIDDRLVRSSRLHSEDMVRRGYFAHNAQLPAPHGVSPFDRMRTAGYTGGGASENIHNGSPSPEGAHESWIHSSGHHRNILSAWVDMGTGQAGRMWTQNFGAGGGRPPVIADVVVPGGAKEEEPRRR
jgi:uncharacterized protein YkwD